MEFVITGITPPSMDESRVAHIAMLGNSNDCYLLNLNPLVQECNKASGAFLSEDRKVIVDAGLIVLREKNNKHLREWVAGDTLEEL